MDQQEADKIVTIDCHLYKQAFNFILKRIKNQLINIILL